MTEFRDRLRHVRSATGLSGRALAALAGVSHETFNFIERENTNPSAETAIKLADALGISVEWLLRGVGDPPAASAIQQATKQALRRAEAS